jgi:hypothetical protein
MLVAYPGSPLGHARKARYKREQPNQTRSSACAAVPSLAASARSEGEPGPTLLNRSRLARFDSFSARDHDV